MPYVDPSVFTWKSGKPDLYMNLFSREHPTLYALGFMETNGGAYKLFDEMADMIARTIMVRAKAGGAAAKLDKVIATDRPDLTGGIRFVGSARHATYVEIDAYRKHMGKLRKLFGWPGLDDGCFDALLKAAPAREAA